RRSGDLRTVRARRHRRGVPVRIARDARTAAAGEAGPLRGPDRAGVAVSPRPDGPDPGLHRTQARAPGSTVSASAAGTCPGTDLRRGRVPGTGDADRADPGR